jgi:dTDP-4-amino-4,6-dideoxygalactose transaminase
VKIAHLELYTQTRQQHAKRYADMFVAEGVSRWIELPFTSADATHVWNQYGIRVPNGLRDSLRKHLSESNIGSEIYYPVPLHLQECYQDLGYPVGSLPHTERAAKEILNLPIYPELKEREQEAVVAGIKRFFSAASLRRAA